MDHTALDRYNAKMWEAGARIMCADNKGSEFLAAVEPYHQEVRRFSEMIQPYLNSYQELFEERLQSVVRWEYGRGGCGIARGCYYPCPVTDLIVGGFNRGKLLKRLKGANLPDYRFGFDQQDRLVTVEWYEKTHSIQKEAIVYQGDISVGITFEQTEFDGGINYIRLSSARKCVYQNTRLGFMETATLMDNEIYNFQIEEYTYSEEGIRTYSKLHFIPEDNLASHYVCGFSHDQEGYLTAYWPIGDNGRTYKEPHIYTITKKRKV